MTLRARKVSGAFEKRAPGHIRPGPGPGPGHISCPGHMNWKECTWKGNDDKDSGVIQASDLQHMRTCIQQSSVNRCPLLSSQQITCLLLPTSHPREDARVTRRQHYRAVCVSEFWYKARESRMQA